MQRRWVPAVFFSVTFSAGFVWFAIQVLATLKAYYEFMTDFNHASGVAPGLAGIGSPFIVCMLIYLASLVDTAIGNRRSLNVRGGPPPM